jgi:hypothetical protein
VRDAWINVLPAGPDLGSRQVAGSGARGPLLDGRPSTVGEVFVVHSAGLQPRYYQLSSGGLAPMTATAAAIALADPAARASYGNQSPRVRELSPAALGSASVVPAPDWQAEVPPTPPTLASGPGRLPCAQVVPGAVRPAVSLVTAPPGLIAQTILEEPELTDDPRVADWVALQPDSGMLARTQPVEGVQGAGLYLVTEDGAKYPVASAEAAEALGVPVSSAVGVPADLLALLPTGPVLDRIGKGGGLPMS